jgi:alkyl hydroperoxide reductase subunit AhpF
MPILSPQDRRTLEGRFKKEMEREVTLTLYTVRSAGLLVVPGRECPTCPQAQELLSELASLSPQITLELVDFYTETQAAQEKAVDRIPCVDLQVKGQESPTIRFYGVPSGYEFVTLVEDVITLSRGVSHLRTSTRKALRKLERDVRIQVFVTPG